MGTPRAKVHYGAATGHLHDPRCFGGDERLKPDSSQQVRLSDLRLHQRRPNRQERFISEDRGAFGNGKTVAGETELAQCVEEFAGYALELRQTAQVIDLLIGEL